MQKHAGWSVVAGDMLISGAERIDSGITAKCITIVRTIPAAQCMCILISARPL